MPPAIKRRGHTTPRRGLLRACAAMASASAAMNRSSIEEGVTYVAALDFGTASNPDALGSTLLLMRRGVEVFDSTIFTDGFESGDLSA